MKRKMKSITSRFFGALGYWLCELAFKTDCRGPFALAYRAGFWCYARADVAE
jgi:hypothetical protein